MKFNFRKFLLGFIFAVAMPALVSAHTVTLSLTKSTDDTGAAGSGYTAWRLSGTCPASVVTTTGFTAVNSTLFTGTSYVDATVTPGVFCYVVTFTQASASSVPSNTASATVLPATATNVTVTGVN